MYSDDMCWRIVSLIHIYDVEIPADSYLYILTYQPMKFATGVLEIIFAAKFPIPPSSFISISDIFHHFLCQLLHSLFHFYRAYLSLDTWAEHGQITSLDFYGWGIWLINVLIWPGYFRTLLLERHIKNMAQKNLHTTHCCTGLRDM